MGTETAPRTTNKNPDDTIEGGFYYGRSGLNGDADSGDNPFPDNGGGYYLIVTADTSARVFQVASVDTGSEDYQMKFRIYSSTTWQPWQELYHTGSLNQFEFGCPSAGDVLAANCAATSTTTCRCYLPVSLFAAAGSITTEGTFTLYDKSFAVFRAAIPAGDVALSNATSFKTVVIEIVNNVGLVDGEQYFLVSDSAASKITVNP